MTSIPSAIIYINSDLNDILLNTLLSQLEIDDHMTGEEFDARVAADPNYPFIIHMNKLRVLVIRSNFRDMPNRYLADLLLFVKQGLVSVLKNDGGPPELTLPVARINIYDLLRFVKSSEVVILPNVPPPPCACSCGCCQKCLGGIFAIESADSSGVYCPNPDNEMNNPDFLNRK